MRIEEIKKENTRKHEKNIDKRIQAQREELEMKHRRRELLMKIQETKIGLEAYRTEHLVVNTTDVLEEAAEVITTRDRREIKSDYLDWTIKDESGDEGETTKTKEEFGRCMGKY